MSISRGLPRFFFSVFIVVSPLFVFRRKPIIFMTAVRSFRGLWCPQQAFGIFARCAAQNTMLVIFVALWRIFSPELISLLRLSMLRQRIRGANATSLTAASVGGISLTLQRDALNHHRCQYSKLVRRSYCAVWAAVW